MKVINWSRRKRREKRYPKGEAWLFVPAIEGQWAKWWIFDLRFDLTGGRLTMRQQRTLHRVLGDIGAYLGGVNRVGVDGIGDGWTWDDKWPSPLRVAGLAYALRTLPPARIRVAPLGGTCAPTPGEPTACYNLIDQVEDGRGRIVPCKGWGSNASGCHPDLRRAPWIEIGNHTGAPYAELRRRG